MHQAYMANKKHEEGMDNGQGTPMPPTPQAVLPGDDDPATGDGPYPEADASRDAPTRLEVPQPVREAWQQLWREQGRKPTRREMQAAVGGSNGQRNAWCQALERDVHQAPAAREAVTTGKAARGD